MFLDSLNNDEMGIREFSLFICVKDDELHIFRNNGDENDDDQRGLARFARKRN